MTNLTPGAKVIYFKSYSFDPAPARVGYIAVLWPDDAVMVATTDDLALWPRCANVHVPRRRCHLYSVRYGRPGCSGNRTPSSCRSNTVSFAVGMRRKSY